MAAVRLKKKEREDTTFYIIRRLQTTTRPRTYRRVRIKARRPKQHDEPKKNTKKQQDKVPCHPQCKETCISSCGKGCCSEEGERLRDKQERKEKDAKEREQKEKAKALQEMYKPQPRLCPAPCPQVQDYRFKLDTATEFEGKLPPPQLVLKKCVVYGGQSA